MGKDFVPHEHGVFYDWSMILMGYISEHFVAWNIPEEAFNVVEVLRVKFDAAYIRALNHNHGKTDTLSKNQTRAAFEKELRNLLKSYVTFNPKVTDTDRIKMGLPIHKKSLTRNSKPETFPFAEFITSMLRIITIIFRDSESMSKAKPKGVIGAEIRWAILETPPVNVEDITNSAFCTRSPFVLTFDECDRGKKVYCCLRWENTRGEKGAWGQIYSVIIP
ncbi:MAG: hypothetical protein LBL39_08335 [Planctomycetaceae bacterium]|jgi:hypothetical protein|nr:hypothetical protein [Planctomycetaceae bacterium]